MSHGSLSCRAVGRCSHFRGKTTGSGADAAVLGHRLRGPRTRVVVAAVRGLTAFVGGGPKRRICRGRIIVVFSRYRHDRFKSVRGTVIRGFGGCRLFNFAKAPVFTIGTKDSASPHCFAATRAFNSRLRACAVISTVGSGGILPFHISCVGAVSTRPSVSSGRI